MSIKKEELDKIINEINVLNLEVISEDFSNEVITIMFGKKDYDVFVVRFDLTELKIINNTNIVEILLKDYLKMSERFFYEDLEMYKIKRKHEINKNYCINILTDNLNEIKDGFLTRVKFKPVEYNPDINGITFSDIEEEIYKDEDLISRLEKCLEILKK